MPHAISDYHFRRLHQPVLHTGSDAGSAVIKDDTFVLETGADRVKIRFTKTAISAVEKLNMDKADKK